TPSRRAPAGRVPRCGTTGGGRSPPSPSCDSDRVRRGAAEAAASPDSPSRRSGASGVANRSSARSVRGSGRRRASARGSTTDIAICRGARRHGRVGVVAGPLEGVRVLELGIWVAVPSAAAVLADWGAAVIKIEPPEGDPLRGLAATGLVPYQPDVN